MSLLLWIVRLVAVILIIRFVMSAFAGARRKPAASAPRQPNRPPERLGGTLVRDPQCGTYLPQDRAIVVTKGGTTEYFCSAKCRDEWTVQRPH